jgi:flagellar basal-body rod protein FlgC
MDLDKAMTISARGMDVQTTRLRIIAENLANQDSTGSTPGAEAYRRKTVSFTNSMDQTLGVSTVKVGKIGTDASEQQLRFDPSNPAANKDGYVKQPNVNSFVEVMDMKEAESSYSANLSVMQATRDMLSRAIQLLK